MTDQHVPGSTRPPMPARPCPICSKPGEHAFRPFCSKRCADIDLNRWLNGVYRIPGGAPPPPGVEDEEF